MDNDILSRLLDVKAVDASEIMKKNAQDKLDNEDDYEYSKRKLKELVDKGNQAIDHASQIAAETGSIDHLDSLSGLIKNVGEIAKNVGENAKTKAETEKLNRDVGNGRGNPSIRAETVFIGTPSELLDKMKADDEAKNKKGNLTIDG